MNAKEIILLAEDEENDVLLIRRAFQKVGFSGKLSIVRDGEEALSYLNGEGKFSDREQFPFPTIVITDLKMPRRNGFEILQWLRDKPECVGLPILVLTSSPAEEDIKKAYRLGANSYFVKPPDFEQLQKLVSDVCNYWNLCRRPKVLRC